MIACSERRIVQDYESSFGGVEILERGVAWRWERVFCFPNKQKRLMAHAELCTPIVLIW